MYASLTVSPLPSPRTVKKALALPFDCEKIIFNFRNEIADILNGKNPKFFLAIGPCSVHNVEEAIEYAQRLKRLAEKTADSMCIAMRVNFEKPRTKIGWKGMLHEPFSSGVPDLNQGLLAVRKLMLEIASIGIPIASELLDPSICYYVGDLLSWAWIGSRTSESQIHRQFASGLPFAVGFKNSTDGSFESAVYGIKASSVPHSFLALDEEGKSSAAISKGNPHCHLILRGGKYGPNYDTSSIEAASSLLRAHQLPPQIVIDCSHDNAQGDHKNQKNVLLSGITQITKGDRRIRGFMIESNLEEGRQEIALKYGVSLTDPCLSWEQTEQIILSAKEMLQEIALNQQ